MWRRTKLLGRLVAVLSALSFVDCLFGIETQNAVLVRNRRATSSRVFVVRRTSTGDLFSVASIPADSSEVFKFSASTPAGLSLNSASGMVSTSAQLSVGPVTFTILRNSSTAGITT